MNQDPFGNLRDWGMVLYIVDELASVDKLSEYQPGLVRILRYKGNWRLREEVLKHVGKIQRPSHSLLRQVLSIVDDDNIYYDARILATDALIQVMQNVEAESNGEINISIRKVTDRLRSTPQPSIFDSALKKLHSEIGLLEIKPDY